MAVTLAAARSHVGLVRRRNEDAFHVGRSLFAVADGLGGHPAGDVASTTAIAAVAAYDRVVSVASLADTLGRAVAAANDAIRGRAADEPAVTGMATTLVAVLCAGDHAVLANVGDSRAYLLSRADARMARLTEDHVYGNLLADAAAVPRLPGRLTRFLDGRPDGRSPDLTHRLLRPGDRWLLCSDGLSSFVPPRQIQEALSTAEDAAGAADRLVELGIDAGGRDNITVVVLDVA